MPDNDDCNARAKAAMRQLDTPLNKSEKEGQKVRSPNSTPGSASKTPKSLNIHRDPYSK
jgi:hypothetical protein